MTREELKEHCEKQVRGCERWAEARGEKPSGSIYEEHKLILELLEQEPSKSKKVETEDIKRVMFTLFEIKMMQMSLYHQWINMTNDDGEAVNCEQKSADCVYNLLCRFENLREESEV